MQLLCFLKTIRDGRYGLIETKEQYEEYQRKIIAVVENRYDPTEIWRTIEALREVARGERDRVYNEWLDLAKKEKAEWFKDWLPQRYPKLDALPDWITED